MLKKILLCVGALALLCPVGCMTTDPVIWSWPHNKRKLLSITHDLHEMHMDFDRIFFDLEHRPIETEY